jgi:hypothetical protein
MTSNIKHYRQTKINKTMSLNQKRFKTYNINHYFINNKLTNKQTNKQTNKKRCNEEYRHANKHINHLGQIRIKKITPLEQKYLKSIT